MSARARLEAGFTVVEVLVAALILAVAVTAAFVTLSSSEHYSLVAERHTELAHTAQNELERLQALPYSQIALTGTSASWSSTAASYTYVNVPGGNCPASSSGAAPTYQPDHSVGGSAATEPLVINGCTYTTTVNGQQSTTTPTTGTVAPVTAWSAPLQNGGTVSGNVYDFITWAADPSCSQTSTPGSACDTNKDYKRVTVVVTMNGVTEPANPVIVSGFVTPPNSGKSPTGSSPTCTNAQGQTVTCTGNPCANCTPHQGFLTDCSYNNTCPTGPPCPGNVLDNTLVAVGVTPAAPDQLSSSPPTGSCNDGGTPPTPKPPCFATDLGCGSGCIGSCGGVPIPSSSSCTAPTASNVQTHAWVTGPIAAGVTWNLTGTGNMTAYLESTTGTTIQATMCVGLYVVPGGVLGTLGGNLLAQPVGAAARADVQATAGVPTPVTFDFNTGSGTYAVVSAGQTRIELVVWITGSSGPVDLVYDQAGVASQFTFNTT